MEIKSGKLLSRQLDIKIALCAEKGSMLEEIYKQVSEIMGQERCTCNIIPFQKAEDVCWKNKSIDITIVDVETLKAQGMGLARHIREENKTVRIVLLSSDMRYIKEAFKIQAYRYLDKNHLKEELPEALRDAVNEERQKRGNGIKINGECKRLFFEDIYYLESLGDSAMVYAKHYNVEIRETLGCLRLELGEVFYRCHKSYIVNLSCIIKVDEKEIQLKNDFSVPVSVRRRRGLIEAYRKFIKAEAQLALTGEK